MRSCKVSAITDNRYLPIFLLIRFHISLTIGSEFVLLIKFNSFNCCLVCVGMFYDFISHRFKVIAYLFICVSDVYHHRGKCYLKIRYQ